MQKRTLSKNLMSGFRDLSWLENVLEPLDLKASKTIELFSINDFQLKPIRLLNLKTML